MGSDGDPMESLILQPFGSTRADGAAGVVGNAVEVPLGGGQELWLR